MAAAEAVAAPAATANSESVCWRLFGGSDMVHAERANGLWVNADEQDVMVI